MATILRTVEEKGHWTEGTPGHWKPLPKGKREWVPGEDREWVVDGYETVREQVVNPTAVGSRKGSVTKKRVEAWQKGTGRRNRSAYQARALASAQGVLAPANTRYTRDPQSVTKQYLPGFATLSEGDVVPVVYPR